MLATGFWGARQECVNYFNNYSSLTFFRVPFAQRSQAAGVPINHLPVAKKSRRAPPPWSMIRKRVQRFSGSCLIKRLKRDDIQPDLIAL
jgi:hypothetical protein